MDDKTFVVTHPRARAPLTITGKNLKDALEKEALDPATWREVPQPAPTEEKRPGRTEEAA